MFARASCPVVLPELPVFEGPLAEVGTSLGAGWPGGGPNAGPALRFGCPALLADRGKSANSPWVQGSDSADLARQARRPRPAALLGCATRATARPPRAGSGAVADDTSARHGGPVHSRPAMGLGEASTKVFLFPSHATHVAPKAVGGRRAQRLCGAEERSGPRVAPRSGVERSCLSTERSEGEFCARPRAASTAAQSPRSGDHPSEAPTLTHSRPCALQHWHATRARAHHANPCTAVIARKIASLVAGADSGGSTL